MAFSYPGGTNTFVPLDITGNLQVGYSRNGAKFAVNQITKLTPVKKMKGDYIYFNPLDLARLPGGLTAQNKWAPGTPRPTGFNNAQGFELRNFTCERYAFPVTLDQLGVEQAEWPVIKINSEAAAQLAMTNRALLVANVLVDTANYPTTHVATASSFGGGAWDAGTVTSPYILRGINAMAQFIQVDTVGRLNYKNLSLVINPNTARKMAQSAEVHDYLARSQWALGQLTGNEKNQNSMYGLPPQLYGVNIVIEDAVYNGDNKLKTAAAPTYVFPDAKAVLLMREEDLEGTEGAMSFSAVHLFCYEDMTVESKEDTWNRLTDLSVVDSVQAKMVSPVSACLATSVVS